MFKVNEDVTIVNKTKYKGELYGCNGIIKDILFLKTGERIYGICVHHKTNPRGRNGMFYFRKEDLQLKIPVKPLDIPSLYPSTLMGFAGVDVEWGRVCIIPKIKKVIFNKPATIVFWSDDTKTVVKCQKGDRFDKEKGLAIAFVKKIHGNKGNYYNMFKEWINEKKI